MAKQDDSEKPSDVCGKRIRRGNPDAYWQMRYSVAGEDFDGPCLGSDGLPTRIRKVAEAYAHASWVEAKAQAKENARTKAGPMTVARAIAAWEQSEHRRNDHVANQCVTLRQHLTNLKLMDTRLVDLTLSNILELRKARAGDETGRRGQVLPGTVNFTMGTFRTILYHARDYHGAALSALPWKEIWGGKVMVENAAKDAPVRVLSAAEVDRAVRVLRPDYLTLLKFYLCVGLRRREALLRWTRFPVVGALDTYGWVDFEQNKIHVTAKRRKQRVIPMTAAVRRMLLAQRAHDPYYVWMFVAQQNQTRDGELIRVKGQRYPITYNGMDDVFEKMFRDAGIEAASIHTLRHTFVTWTLEATKDLVRTSKAAGHSNVATTAKYYIATTQADELATLEALAQYNAAEMAALADGNPESVNKVVNFADALSVSR